MWWQFPGHFWYCIGISIFQTLTTALSIDIRSPLNVSHLYRAFLLCFQDSFVTSHGKRWGIVWRFELAINHHRLQCHNGVNWKFLLIKKLLYLLWCTTCSLWLYCGEERRKGKTQYNSRVGLHSISLLHKQKVTYLHYGIARDDGW